MSGIAASYVSAGSFTVTGDLTAQFVAGVRVKADCGADGLRLGTVTAASFSDSSTTVTVTLDSGSLTANLAQVWHGNDNPDSLVRATTTYPGASELATSAESVAGTDTALVPPVSAHRQAFLSWLRDTVGEFVGLPLPAFNLFAPLLALPATASFTRGSSGYRIAPNGLLESKTTNAPRWTFDPLLGLVRGLRVEGASTNNWLYSEKAGVVRALTLTSVSGTFQVGETINGTTGSGVVASVDGSVLGLSSSSGTFSGTVTGVTSGATGTYSAIATIHQLARASVTANVAIAPDGTQTGDKVVEDGTAANSHYDAQSFSVTSGTTYTFSWFLQAAGRTKVQLSLPAAQFAASCNGVFDLTAVTATAGAGAVAARIEDHGGGWHRCSVTGVCTSTAAALAVLFLLNAAGSATYDGDGTSGVNVWSAQFEAASFPSTYIQTADTAVTRAADLCTAAVSGFDFNVKEGAIFVSGRTPAGAPLTGATQTVCALDDGTANNRIIIERTSANALQCVVTSGGSTVATLSLGTVANNTDFKVAVSWRLDDFRASLNGGTVVADTGGAVPVAPTTLRVGANATPAMFWAGTIRHLAYFPRALTSAQLQAITL